MSIVNNFECGLGEIATSQECSLIGSLQRAAWANFEDLDWDAIADTQITGNIIDDVTMNGAAVFNELRIEKELSFYQSEYTADNRYYDTLATLVFNGKSAENAAVFTEAIRCCNIVLFLWDNNAKGRVLGVDLVGDVLDTPLRPLRIVRHLDAGGQLGTDEPRDEIDLQSWNLGTALFHDISWSDFESYLSGS